MDPTLEAAFDGAFEGAFDGGGDPALLLLCEVCEVCLEACVCEDFALDLLE